MELVEKYPILSFLVDKNIEFELYEHPAVFSVGECLEHTSNIPGVGTKNLFLRDKKKQNYALLFVKEDKRVNLEEISKHLNWSRISFASPEDLEKILGVTPGSVTPMALLPRDNFPSRLIDILIDKDLTGDFLIQMHPLVNTATVVVHSQKFIDLISEIYPQMSKIKVTTKC
jgi:Ala-tRNA(Pro) deacylase